MEIQWTKHEFGVGNDDLDAQHQQLFLLTNQFLGLKAAPPGPRKQESLLSIIKQLVAYSRYHFSTEEALFEHYGFPKSAAHRLEHEAFTAKVTEVFGTAQEGDNLATDELANLLVNWLHHHIQKEDRGYAAYFQSKGIKVDIHFSSGEKATGSVSEVRDGAKVLWTEKQLGLELGAIDHQHQELVLILQQASDLLRANEERRKTYLPLILDKLYHYAQYHFLYEEELMSRHGFTDLPAHKEQHVVFTNQVLEFSHQSATRRASVNEEVVGFLKGWIVEHILVEDKKFKTEFQKAFPGKKMA